MGGDGLHSGQDRLYAGDASELGERQAERDQGLREGLTSSERERLRALEQENRELKRANEILRTASGFFAQAELDRKLKIYMCTLNLLQ